MKQVDTLETCHRLFKQLAIPSVFFWDLYCIYMTIGSAEHSICDGKLSSLGFLRANDQLFDLYQGSVELQDMFLQRDVICKRKYGFLQYFRWLHCDSPIATF